MKTQPKKHHPRGRPKGSGSQFVYDELRNQIVTLIMKPGTVLDELALVRSFNVSRTPVREALIKLEADGLVEIIANRGARVASLNFDNVTHLFEAMDLYSRAICHLAATRLDRAAISLAHKASNEFEAAAKRNDFREMGEANWRFHFALGRASGNSYIADAQTRILNETMRLAYLAHSVAVKNQADYRAYFDRIISEHEEMLAQIEAGNAAQAEALALKHTKLFQENLSQYILRNEISTIQVGDLFETEPR